jgi:hypothetical protein
MSVQQMALVWGLKLPHNQAWILMAYADHADQDGDHVHPSIGKIAWKTGYSSRQVQRIVKDLEAKGLMELVRYRKGGRGVFPLYRLTLEKGDKKSPFKKRDISERVTSEQKKGDILSKKGDIQMSTESSLEPLVKQPSERAREKISKEHHEKKKPNTTSHFFPEDFPRQPSEEFLAWAAAELPNIDVSGEWKKMLDHEFKKPYSDWWKVARNWMRKAPQFNSNGHQPSTQYRQPHCAISGCKGELGEVGQFCEYHGG